MYLCWQHSIFVWSYIEHNLNKDVFIVIPQKSRNCLISTISVCSNRRCISMRFSQQNGSTIVIKWTHASTIGEFYWHPNLTPAVAPASDIYFFNWNWYWANLSGSLINAWYRYQVFVWVTNAVTDTKSVDWCRNLQVPMEPVLRTDHRSAGADPPLVVTYTTF